MFLLMDMRKDNIILVIDGIFQVKMVKFIYLNSMFNFYMLNFKFCIYVYNLYFVVESDKLLQVINVSIM